MLKQYYLISVILHNITIIFSPFQNIITCCVVSCNPDIVLITNSRVGRQWVENAISIQVVLAFFLQVILSLIVNELFINQPHWP